MLLQLLHPSLPEIKFKILRGLDKETRLKCRLVCTCIKKIMDDEFTFEGYLCDKKLSKKRIPLSALPLQKLPPANTESKSKEKMKSKSKGDNKSSSRSENNVEDACCSCPSDSEFGFKIKKLVIGKLMHDLKKVQHHVLWDAVEEVEFTRPISAKNYHLLLKACTLVKVIRVNYLAIGGKKVPSYALRLRNRLYGIVTSRRNMREHDIPNRDYYLPKLQSIFMDRALDTFEFIANRNRNKFKHFDADLYFKTMAGIIDDLEKEVQVTIIEMIRNQVQNRTPDDPNTGFFFTKPFFVNRFPMTTAVLNKFSSKLR